MRTTSVLRTSLAIKNAHQGHLRAHEKTPSFSVGSRSRSPVPVRHMTSEFSCPVQLFLRRV